MVAKVVISGVNLHNLSKQDEVEVLAGFVAGLPANSYLAGLFTPAMMQWVTGSIIGDVYPDLFEIWADTSRKFDNLTAEKFRLEEDLTREGERVKYFRDRAEEMERQRDQSRAVLYDERAEASRDIYAAQHAQERCDRENEELREELTRLKAKLFDLMEAHGK